MRDKQGISSFQLAFLLINAQIGVGIISLPFDAFMKAGGDSWISVILTGVMIQIIILIIWALMIRFPTKNIYGVAESLFGKWIGKTFVLLYCFYFIAVGSAAMARYAYIIKAWMLPITPTWIILVLMAVTAGYIVKDNLQIMVRFFVLSSIVLAGFIGLSAYALKDANITYILPVGKDGVLAALKGIPPSLPSFQGYELLLVVFPFVQAGRQAVLKAVSIANAFVTLFYTFLVVTCLLFFSPEELGLVPEPVLYLIKSFSFKIIERPDLLFTSMWIVLVATTIMNLLYVSSLGLASFANSKKITNCVYLVAFLFFMIAIGFEGKYDIAAFAKMNHKLIFFFAVAMPVVLLFISILFKKDEREGKR